MPTRKSKKVNKGASKARASGKRAVTKARPRGPSLLILECDAERLASDAITAGGEAYAAVRALMPKARVALVRSTSQHDLLEQLAACKAEHGTFNLVIIVGHSNSTGLKLTAERGVTWPAFARWIEIFEPKKVVLLACEAGQRLPAEALFDGLPKLQEIYASPIKLYANQARAVAYLALYLLQGKPDHDLIQTAKMMLFAFTGAIIYQWKRTWYKSRGEAVAAQWDLLQPLLNRGAA